MIPNDRIPHAVGAAFPSARALRLSRDAIARYELDLDGLVVLTEAATGYYRLTPVIAAMAGAEEVVAVARNTPFGSADEAREQVLDLGTTAGVLERLTVTTTSARDVAPRAQVVTNLGAVRPIDRAFSQRLSSHAVVSLMFGARDARPADLDVAALRAAQIPLCGVDEAQIDLFRWTGQRIAWWLMEVGLEIVGARYVIWGDSAPAKATARWLDRSGAHVERLTTTPSPTQLEHIDGLILMDSTARIEPGGHLAAESIAGAAPGAAILEYAGMAHRESCAATGLVVYPPSPAANGHVARTIGEILYAPVIELHTAGLRVGELMARGRLEGKSAAECELVACEEGPGEPLPSQ